jgi:uncharacterized protein with HEPN domain
MRGKLGDKQRIIHIIEAIDEIERYTANQEFSNFIDNSMMRFASVKQIEIIGEAANLITPETRDKFPDIPWKQIIGLRHILVHEYFGIDIQLIWQIITDDLADLKEKVQNILEQMS